MKFVFWLLTVGKKLYYHKLLSYLSTHETRLRARATVTPDLGSEGALEGWCHIARVRLLCVTK